MSQYYYLVSSLPDLSPDDEFQRHPFPVFQEFVREELNVNDYADLRKCFLLNDVYNFSEALKPTGDDTLADFRTPAFYTGEDFDEGLLDPESLFSFFADYIWDVKAEKRQFPGISGENELLRRMMETISAGDEPAITGFPRDYLEFEIRLRNLTTAISRRIDKQSYSEDIIPFDYFSEEISISQAADFGLGGELGLLSELVDKFDNSTALAIEKSITAVRWAWLDDQVDYNFFSRNAVFAAAVKFADVDRWISISPEDGRQKLDELLEQLHQNIRKMTREENSE